MPPQTVTVRSFWFMLFRILHLWSRTRVGGNYFPLLRHMHGFLAPAAHEANLAA
jgi:hypothetical protein